MRAFGTSELAILKETPQFGETRYVCDIEKMIDGILRTYEALLAETARYPCAIHMHPADYFHLRTDKRFVGVVSDAGSAAYFLSMRVSETPTLPKGSAQLSICPGCLTFLGTCANKAML